MTLQREVFFNRLYFFGIILLVISMPLSMFVMSVSQFMILGAWLLGGNMIQKFKTAFTNKIVLILAGVYFLHLLGLLWTSNFDYALKDIRIKLPLLSLPVIFSSGYKLSRKEVNWVLKFFVAAVAVSSLISLYIFLGFTKKEINDIREISIFISHIRLSLLVCMAIYCCIYFIQQNLFEKKIFFVLLVALIVWLLIFLSILESVTGIGILLVCLTFFLFSYFLKQKKLLPRFAFLTAMILLLFFVFAEVESAWKRVTEIKKPEPSSLQKLTVNGNSYVHEYGRFESENGTPVNIYICEKELEQEWNKRSTINYFTRDRKDNEIRYTLIRFLASKGLKKDSLGVSLLNDKEIKAIEGGTPNVIFLEQGNINSRIYTVAWEINNYLNGGKPNGHSLTMRFEFWKAAMFIISKHPWAGVGTGDVPRAFNKAYIQINSPLDENWRLRAHNQFLTVAVALGIPALLYFIFSLVAPMILISRKRTFLYTAFFITAILSMLTEDTLETQAGITFFVFFNSFFIFLFKEESDDEKK